MMPELSLNILDVAENSIRANASLIEINVLADTTKDILAITIKDNGCGMTHKQTENIFHPFITYKPEGTGLGLAVTAEIISAHHGQIRVSSTPGQGSAFYIYLPASPE